MPVNDLPAVDYPVIQVQVNYPGATPETMANNVATPLERQFMQIPGLEEITSNSGTGHTSFVLQFALSKSLDAAATDVQAAITQATGKLPVDLPSPPTFTQDESERSADSVRRRCISDSVTEGQLYDYANTQVGERISILPGVSQVSGVRNPVRRAHQGRSVGHGLAQYHHRRSGTPPSRTERVTPAPDNSTESTKLSAAAAGPVERRAEDYEQLIVGQRNGAPVYLKDIAAVKNSVQDERIEHALLAARTDTCRRRRW